MLKLFTLFVVAAVLNVATSQGPPDFRSHRGPPPNIPEKCLKPPPNVKNPQTCCVIAPIFNQEDFDECGIDKTEYNSDTAPIMPECSKQQCLLSRKDLMSGSEISYPSLAAFLESWVDQNQAFYPAVDAIMGGCITERGPPGPPQICEANRLMFCIGSLMFSNCPDESWVQNEECSTLKQHMIDCNFRYVMPKPKPQ